jgi:hypothetical protein
VSVRCEAQASPGETPPGYAQLVEQALAEYEAHNYFEARSLFTRAHALFPNARTQRGLGIVEFAVRNYDLAADYLQQALDSKDRPLTGELRQQTVNLLEQVHGFLARVELRVEPAAARVLVDNESYTPTEGKTLSLKVGDHIIEAQLEGYTTERRTLRIQGRETLRVVMILHPLESNATAAGSQNVAQPRTDGAGPHLERAASSAWPWVVVGAGTALAVGGGVLLYLGKNDIAAVEDAKMGTQWQALKSENDRGPILANAGWVLAGVGVATIAMGLLWRFAWSDGEPAANVDIAIGPHHVAIATRF